MTKRFLAYRSLVGFTCQTPVFALYYLANGLDYRGLMLLTLAFAASKIACDVPSGMFADRCGRRASILIRVGLEAVSVALLFAGQFLVSSVLAGAAAAFSAGAEQALVYEWYGRRFAKVFGRAASWGCVSTAAASLVGAALATIDFRLVYALRLVALLGAGGVAATFRESPRAPVPASARAGRSLPAHLVRPLALVGVLGAVQVAALQLQQPFLVGAGVPLAALGALYVAFQLGTAAGARFAHRLRSPLTTVVLASAAGFALMAAPIGPAAVAAVFLLKLAHGISLPAFSATLNAAAPAASRATSLSFRSLFEGAAILAAAPLLGWVADASSLPAAFAVASALILPTLWLLEPAPCVAPAGSRLPA